MLAKAKGQTAKVNIKAALVDDIISLEEVKEDMAAVLTTLKEDFSRNLSIRTSPGQDLAGRLCPFNSMLWCLTRLPLQVDVITTLKKKNAGLF